jgi:hypothetical protein
MEWIGKHATISHWKCSLSCGTIGGLCTFQFSSFSRRLGVTQLLPVVRCIATGPVSTWPMNRVEKNKIQSTASTVLASPFKPNSCTTPIKHMIS